MWRHRLGIFLLWFVVLRGAGVTAQSWQPASALPARSAAFADSIGINVHLSYKDTLYFQDFPLVRSSVIELGIHHVRDGLQSSPSPEYVDRCKQLARAGIHFDMITSLGQSAQNIRSGAALLSPAIESFEAPNELDAASGTWAERLREYLPVLYAGVKALGDQRKPVVGPSLTRASSYASLGMVSAYADFGNLHNYMGGHHPGTSGWGDDGYGSYAWNLRNVAITTPDRPVITTETGYTNHASAEGHLPEAIVARYLPRLLLEQWMHGIQRTYLYELLSSGGEDFGLLRSDGSHKPAFHAVANLMRLMNDPGPSGAVQPLKIELTGDTSDLQHVLFQRGNGTYLLALWIEASGFDLRLQKEMAVPLERVHVVTEPRIHNAELIYFTDSGAITRRPLQADENLELNVDDHVVILQFKPAPTARARQSRDRVSSCAVDTRTKADRAYKKRPKCRVY